MRINPEEAMTMRAQGSTLQAIADRFGVTKTAVSLYFSRSRTRANKPRDIRSCGHCGKPVVVSGAKRHSINVFCSSDCYHDWYPLKGGPAWRHGQRLAKRAVNALFVLQPGHIVHHCDGNNRHNTLDNLWVFQCHGDHISYHRGGLGEPIWRGPGSPEYVQRAPLVLPRLSHRTP